MTGESRYEGDLRELPLGSLAYVGDAVYELGMRTHVLQGPRRKAGKLHHLAVHYVNAGAQAKAFRALVDEKFVTDDEEKWLLRGRNVHPGAMAKNQDPLDYRLATGVETLFGYLYLSGRDARIDELLNYIIDVLDADQS